jgi:fibro-slime domain-containing protein
MNSAGQVDAQPSHRVLVALGAIFLLTGAAAGQDPPSVVDLPVVIRDFSETHPDFDVLPADGYGYYHGNVAFDLDEQGKPVFTGAGFRARSLWKDVNGNPIAPHLFNTCAFLTPVGGGGGGGAGFGLTVAERVKVEKHSVVDSFDSNLGPYGRDNSGAEALVRVNGSGDDRFIVKVHQRSRIKGDVMVGPDRDPERSVRVRKQSSITGTVGQLEADVEIPDVEVPELGPSAGSVKYKGSAHKGKGRKHRGKRRGHKDQGREHTISGDLHCRKLSLSKGAVVNIEGDVTILCDEKLDLDDGSEIRLMPDSTLTLYVGEKVSLDDGSRLNMNTGDPQLVAIYLLGALADDDDDDDEESKLKLDDSSQMAASVQGPDAVLKVEDRSEFFGAFMGKRVKVKRGRLHVDMAAGGSGGPVVYEPEECDLGDLPGTILAMSEGDVLSAGTFAEWWRDVLGVNMSTTQTIRMTRNKFGVYFYLADNFRPIDGQLLGNEGDVHNYHFTLELDADFTYDASAGQWFEVRCTDDAYLFINGRLVIDLGGYGFNKVQYLELDRLGLPDGEPARLQLFHAQRQRGLAIFRLRTNIVLAESGTSPSVNAVLDD